MQTQVGKGGGGKGEDCSNELISETANSIIFRVETKIRPWPFLKGKNARRPQEYSHAHKDGQKKLLVTIDIGNGQHIRVEKCPSYRNFLRSHPNNI